MPTQKQKIADLEGKLRQMQENVKISRKEASGAKREANSLREHNTELTKVNDEFMGGIARDGMISELKAENERLKLAAGRDNENLNSAKISYEIECARLRGYIDCVKDERQHEIDGEISFAKARDEARGKRFSEARARRMEQRDRCRFPG